MPLRTAEFLVVDTETNGRAGDACEVTEIGAVLVGGGELHDRWETLLQVRAPLSRGIQRFTGITQAMVDGAPPAELRLPELAALMRGRVFVGHSAAFDVRVLRQAFAREGVAWPAPPVLCTVALARRLAPLARQRKLAPLAAHLGIEVDVTHRALADAETTARVLCALLPRLAAQAGTLEEARALLGPARPRRPRAGATDGGRSLRGVRRRSVDVSHLPREPGVYVFRNSAGQPLYVGKSIDVRTRARAHFAASSPDTDWAAQVELVEYETTVSELGALLLEHRRIRELRPPGNVRHKGSERGVYLRCRLDIAFPVLEVAPEPAAGRAVNIGPLRARHAALELVEQLQSLFGLRHCGRALPKRPWPSAYGQMGRCLSPCLGDLDPNAYRARLDAALALLCGVDAAVALGAAGAGTGGAAVALGGAGAVTEGGAAVALGGAGAVTAGGAAVALGGAGSAARGAAGATRGKRRAAHPLLAHLDAEMRRAAAEQAYERAGWLRRRRARLAELLEQLGGALEATHARPRLILAEAPIVPPRRGRPAPPRADAVDAVWLVGGRVADHGAVRTAEELLVRSRAALRGAPSDPLRPTHLSADEVAAARIVTAWCAAQEPVELDLAPFPEARAFARALREAGPGEAPWAAERSAAPPSPLPEPELDGLFAVL